jgi:hypothetical protein
MPCTRTARNGPKGETVNVSDANEVVQRDCTSREEARLFLRLMPEDVIRGVADLNHVNPDGRKMTVINRILDDRFGA